ncbi:MAG: hypothetical protein KGL31_04390 [candidate division NC10 bacterium]|nr:hypothetical protein [candidate division NC10 bacterium]MDE2321141.1 hypothetical protein [candidate division NC10 bacterium]
MEEADIFDVGFEHGDTRELQPWHSSLTWRDGVSQARAAHECSEFLHRLIEPPFPEFDLLLVYQAPPHRINN